MNIIQTIRNGYDRVKHGIDEDQWYNFDEYRAIVTQRKCAEKLSYMEDEEDKKWSKILKQISWGMGSYIDMCSGEHKMESAEYKRLEKEWIKAEMLLIKHYKTIWTR